jgi:HTH-type transcriptional regulator / antitoxin HigA
MKWNAIITKSQYEKALKRVNEISRALPGSEDEDELRLLSILIKDYENRQNEMLGLDLRTQIFQGPQSLRFSTH